MASPAEFIRPWPDSIEEHNRHEERMERLREAVARHRRQQAELFELGGECPNCTEAGGGVVVDALTGDEACSLCVRVRE